MWTDDQIKDFYDNYRESLSKQYESNLQSIDQQRENAQASIMSGANKAGMMYSNFPERSKLQYDVETYQPAQVKAQNTYQTGLDSLRNNILNYKNNIIDIQEAIDTMNRSYSNTGNGGTGGTGGNGGGGGDGGGNDDTKKTRTLVTKEEEKVDPVLGPETITPEETATANLNAYAAVTGGGQLPETPRGTKFSYTLNGKQHTGYVYTGQGGVIDDHEFTKDGLREYLQRKVKNGATIQNYLGNDVSSSLWLLAEKLY